MRWFTLMVLCAVLVTSSADPEPKKYKSTVKKNRPSNTTLTAEERDFLREVEAKFGIKSDGKDIREDTDSKSQISVKTTSQSDVKLPFPAVIAIEIVNDTDTKSSGKGKRTIDANLGYGYKTNNGYSYTYFGKPAHEQGKFMIYPYSQEDIPPAHGHTSITDVEITPSRAFELVESGNDDKEAYHYPKPAIEFQTNSPSPSYLSNVNSHGSSQFVPSTLYTTYNGHEFSGLSGQFPNVMPNYLVDPSQLLKTPEYQNVGLTDDHLRPHSPKISDQRVVPVLVLRIPSSSLRNPTAELFANLPSNYPLSSYLNNVNLQDLVNQYFKKLGYSFAPQVTHYQNSPLPTSVEAPSVSSNYGRQHYATPHVQPSYTQSDHSGVQYSAVQPVMARYPSSYTQHFKLNGHSLYHQPQHQQKYEYRYQYVPQHVQTSHPTVDPQAYYIQPQYQQHTQEVANGPASNAHTTSTEVQYELENTQQEDTGSYEYRSQTPQVPNHEAVKVAYEYINQQSLQTASPAYEYVQQQNVESASPSYDHARGSAVAQQYYSHGVPEQKETEIIYQSQVNQNEYVQTGDAQTYKYQQQSNEESEGDNLILSENYPSKDHTIATVLPVSYTAKAPNVGAVQTVSYVTPMPYSSKYQSPYRIMVPQTFLTSPSTERVAYVNSQSVSAFTHPQQENPEAEYTLGPHQVPPVGKQKPPSYPRNYHSHPKRMAKPDNKQDSNSMFSRKQGERNEKKKS